MLRLARATLSRGMLGIIAGDEGNTVTGSAAGLSLSKTGQLSIDETKLKANFGAAFDQLQALFASGSGGLDLDATLDTALLTNTGTVDMKSTFLTERMTLLQDRIDRIESRLERRRATLLAQFARMEATIGALQGQASFLTSQSSSLSRTRPS
jgi:flagellar hook-associated protein 2